MKLLKTLFVAALSVCAAAATAAEAYPSRPIRMVIAFPAGGPTDVNARLFAQAMSTELGQPVVVENRPGAGGNIASVAVASAPADGYTLLYNTSSLLLGAMLYTSAKFDPLKDFVPVVRTAGVPLVVAVNPKVPAKNVRDLVGVAKAKPGSINYASSGAGTIDHLAGALLASELNIDMVHVPYKGTAPALTDLVAGNTQVMVTTLNTLLPFAKDQRLRPLAIASLKRSKLLPDVPTVAEAAQIPGFEITAWNGIVAPAGTAPEIVGKLNATVNRILARKDFQEKLAAGGAEAYGGTSAAYGEYLRSEMLRWRVVIHRAGVTPQ